MLVRDAIGFGARNRWIFCAPTGAQSGTESVALGDSNCELHAVEVQRCTASLRQAALLPKFKRPNTVRTSSVKVTEPQRNSDVRALHCRSSAAVTDVTRPRKAAKPSSVFAPVHLVVEALRIS